MGSDYCNPILKPGERWDHSAESQLIIDIWDNVPGCSETELRPQTVKLVKKAPPTKKVAASVRS